MDKSDIADITSFALLVRGGQEGFTPLLDGHPDRPGEVYICGQCPFCEQSVLNIDKSRMLAVASVTKTKEGVDKGQGFMWWQHARCLYSSDIVDKFPAAKDLCELLLESLGEPLVPSKEATRVH